jgi:tetratricopeptide (TPR) repeat protein
MRSNRLPQLVEAGWVNLPYSLDQNRNSPDLNQASPGAPYFVGTDTAVPGQWVRLVFDERCWCVGEVEKVESDSAVTVARVELEAGDAPVGLDAWRWRGRIERDVDDWNVTLLIVDRIKATFVRTPELLAELDRALAFQPDHSYALAERGQQRLVAGDPEGAIEDLTRLIGLGARWALGWVHNDRGLAHHTRGAIELARDDFRAALALEKKAPKILRNLAQCERELGDDARALALLDEAVALAPRYGRVWFERGELLQRLGKKSLAEQSFAQATKAKFRTTPPEITALRERWIP